MKKIIYLCSIAVLLTVIASFKPEADGYQVGDAIEDFSLKNIDGKMVSLADYKKAKGFIVVFTCNHCPYAKMYEDRIVALDKKYKSQGYPVIAINPNDPVRQPKDSFENMKVRANEKGFTFPYLIDETQAVAARFGAKYTPHVFIVNKDGSNMKVAYIGAIDDNYKDASAATKKYVENAIDELKAGKSVSNNAIKGIGCSIKWKES